MKTIDPPTRLVFDSFQSVMQAVRDGFGIGWSLRAVIADHIAIGCLGDGSRPLCDELAALLSLLSGAQPAPWNVLRLFIDFLLARRGEIDTKQS